MTIEELYKVISDQEKTIKGQKESLIIEYKKVNDLPKKIEKFEINVQVRNAQILSQQSELNNIKQRFWAYYKWKDDDTK